MLSKKSSDSSSINCNVLGFSLLIQYQHWQEQGDRIIERKKPSGYHLSKGKYKENLIIKSKDSPSKNKLSLRSSKVLVTKESTIISQNIMEESGNFRKKEKINQQCCESASNTRFFDNNFANKTLKTSKFFSKSDQKNLKEQQQIKLYNNAPDELNCKLYFRSQIKQIVEDSDRIPVSEMKTKKLLKIIKQIQNTGRSGNTSKYENDEDIQVSGFYSHQGIGEENHLDLQAENLPLAASIVLKKKTTKRFHRILQLDCKSASSIDETQSDNISQVISEATIFDSFKDHSLIGDRKHTQRHFSLMNHIQKNGLPFS